MAIVTTKKISSTKIETTEGIVLFYITDYYKNNKFWKTIFSKEDARIYNQGPMYFAYKTEKHYNNAIKRAKKTYQLIK